MAARRSEGLKIVALLVAALVGIAVLPSSSRARLTLSVTDQDRGGTCGVGFKADWNSVRSSITPITYADLVEFVPPTKDGVGVLALPNTFVSNNSFGGSLDNTATKVKYLVEVHSPYIGGSSSLYDYRPRPGGTEYYGRILDQVVTVQYLDNSKAIYASVNSLLEFNHADKIYPRGSSLFYHRIDCREGTSDLAVDELYEGLFSAIDSDLRRKSCNSDGTDTFKDPYGERRKIFIKEVVDDACATDGKTSEAIKPLFNCTSALNAIPKLLRISYDGLTQVFGVSHPSYEARNCPYRSIYHDSEKNSGILWLEEYHVDDLHPLIAYSLVNYKLDTKKRTLTARVLVAPGYGSYNHKGLYPHDRVGVKVLEYNPPVEGAGGFAKELELRGCQSEGIFRWMESIDDKYKVSAVIYKRIGPIYGESDEKDQLPKYDPAGYRAQRHGFVDALVQLCHR